MIAPPLVTSGAAALASFLAVAALRRWAPRVGLLDVPNARSSHTRPTPRGGGAAIVACFLVGGVALLPWLPETFHPAALRLFAGAALVAAVSLIDDVRSLPAQVRLLTHVAAAIAAVPALGGLGRFLSSAGGEAPVAAGMIVALAPVAGVFWLVTLTNTYNFMDGIDGIAAGNAIVLAASIALVSWWTGDRLVFALGSLLVGATAGFLAHNYPPARIFMGDVGSAFLGFTLAWLIARTGVWLAASGDWFAALLVLAAPAPFLFDSGVTLLRRMARGERWYQSHRSHYYQRLVQLGFSHRQVTHFYYLLAVMAALPLITSVVFGRSWVAMGTLATEAALLVGLAATVPAMEKGRAAVTSRVLRIEHVGKR